MARFVVGQHVRVADSYASINNRPDVHAGQCAEVLKVYDETFLEAYRVRYCDRTEDTMLSQYLVEVR